MAKWFLTGISRLYNGEKTISSTNDTGKTGYPCAKEWSWILILYHIQQLKMDQRPKGKIPRKKT